MKKESGKKNPGKDNLFKRFITFIRSLSPSQIITAIIFTSVGVAMNAYPFVANYVFENRADSLVESVEETAEEIVDEEKQEALEEAQQYNESLNESHVQLSDPFLQELLTEEAGDYNTLLNMTDDGVMGSIEIPSIDVNLPIYHGTSDEVLEKGAGHLEGTSLPIGGESTHCVLTGHTGLSNAKLFTDLTELVEGDIFFLHVFGETLAYEVDKIQVVLPTELDDLYITEGEDYVTLITCTPYGINSHRLLVRGKRTEYEKAVETAETTGKKTTESRWMKEYKRALAISVTALIICVSLLFYYIKRKRRKKENTAKSNKLRIEYT